jgi:hypothetical protein
MKITKTQLRNIIKEELEAVMGEQVLLEELDNQIIEKYAHAVAGGMRGNPALALMFMGCHYSWQI